MFLATTAISEFWDKSSDILFLGEWCLRYDRRNEWEGLSYEVLPYPWTDRDEKHRAYSYCSHVYEVILPDLAAYCNRLHGVSFSLRYWRIVIGEWLWRYIQIIYDRYICIRMSLESAKDLTTILLSEDSYQYATDNLEFVKGCASFSDMGLGIYNLQIYSQILRILGFKSPSKSYVHPQIPNSEIAKEVYNFKSTGKEVSSLLIDLLFKLPPEVQVVFVGNFKIGRKYLLKLSLKNLLKYRELNIKDVVQELSPDRNTRKDFCEMRSEDSFHNICLKMMEYCFPMMFVEGFKQSREKAQGYIRNVPDIILSPVSWRFNTSTAIYIAECVEKGAKLIGVQHGGGYGLYKMDSLLDHELEAVDRFISWGWTDNNKKIIPLPAFNSNEKVRKYTVDKEDIILFVSNSHKLYLTGFQSSPVSTTFENYLSWQKKFVLSLKEEVRNIFLFRLYPKEYGFFKKLRLQDTVKGLKYDNFKTSFIERAKKSRLVVIDNNQTTFLEAIALNIPTVIFWDMNLWEIRSSAKRFFDDLKEVKVFHDSPESAADFINENYMDIDKWWESKKVQHVVNEFRYTYARTSKNLTNDWNKAIAHELD